MNDEYVISKMKELDDFLKIFLSRKISDYDIDKLNESYTFINQIISEIGLYLKTGLCQSYDNIKNILDEIANEIFYKKYGYSNKFDICNFSINKSINDYLYREGR